MKILLLGDIVGREARKTVLSGLPKLKNKYEADIIIINIENAAGGRGVTPKIAEQFFDAGVDILTTGNHVWDQREIIKYIADSNSLLRPINMPEGTPGLGRMSMGPGMYGKGSKISYGNYHKPTYAKGSAGQSNSPFSMNSAHKIHKHMKGKK